MCYKLIIIFIFYYDYYYKLIEVLAAYIKQDMFFWQHKVTVITSSFHNRILMTRSLRETVKSLLTVESPTAGRLVHGLQLAVIHSSTL